MTTIDERAVSPDLTALLAAHRVCGELISILPAEARITGWSISSDGLRAQSFWNGSDDESVRLRMRSTATLTGLTYQETRKRDHVSVAAVGTIDGVRVEIWDHVERQYDLTGGAA